MSYIATLDDLLFLQRTKLISNSTEELARILDYPALNKNNGLVRASTSSVIKWGNIVTHEMTKDTLNYFVAEDIKDLHLAYKIASEHYNTLIEKKKYSDDQYHTYKYIKKGEILGFLYCRQDSLPEWFDKDISEELCYQKRRFVKQFYCICILLMCQGYLYPLTSKVKSIPDFKKPFQESRQMLLQFIRSNGAPSMLIEDCEVMYVTDSHLTRFKLIMLYSFILDNLALHHFPEREGGLLRPELTSIPLPLPDISYWKWENEKEIQTYYYAIRRGNDGRYRIAQWKSGGFKAWSIDYTISGICAFIENGTYPIKEIKDNEVKFIKSDSISIISFNNHFEKCDEIYFSPLAHSPSLITGKLRRISKESIDGYTIFDIFESQAAQQALPTAFFIKGVLAYVCSDGFVFDTVDARYLLKTDNHPELEFIGNKYFKDCYMVEYNCGLFFYFDHMNLIIPVTPVDTTGDSNGIIYCE